MSDDKEKKYTYPRVNVTREIIHEDTDAPAISLIFTTIVINQHGEETIEQLISFYPYFGKRDVEAEVDSANVFHEMCRDAYFSDPIGEDDDYEDEQQEEEGEKPLNDDDITFNEEDERW